MPTTPDPFKVLKGLVFYSIWQFPHWAQGFWRNSNVKINKSIKARAAATRWSQNLTSLILCHLMSWSSELWVVHLLESQRNFIVGGQWISQAKKIIMCAKHLLMMTTGPERWSDEMSFVGGYEPGDQMPSHLLLDFNVGTRQRRLWQTGREIQCVWSHLGKIHREELSLDDDIF